MMKSFEFPLPENFIQTYHIQATEKKNSQANNLAYDT